MATCDQNMGEDLNAKMDDIIQRWEQLFATVEKFMAAGEISRTR